MLNWFYIYYNASKNFLLICGESKKFLFAVQLCLEVCNLLPNNNYGIVVCIMVYLMDELTRLISTVKERTNTNEWFIYSVINTQQTRLNNRLIYNKSVVV